jgi:hypothetical protein
VSFCGLAGTAGRANAHQRAAYWVDPENREKAPRRLELSISIVRKTLRFVFCGNKASAFVTLTVQIAPRYLAPMQIVTLDACECCNGSAVSGFSLQIWPGWKWITGLSDLVAQ